MVRRCWVNFQCWGVLLIWIIVGQGPIVLALGAGGGCLDIFSLICHFSTLFPSLWETARYRLKYCLKGPLSPKQPTNHLIRQGVFREGSDLIPEVSSSNLLCPSNKKASCLREAADVDPQTLKFSQWGVHWLKLLGAHVFLLCVFSGADKTCRLLAVSRGGISCFFFGGIIIVKHLLNRLQYLFGKLICRFMI